MSFDLEFWSTLSGVIALAVLLLVTYKAIPLIGLSTLMRSVVGLYMKPKAHVRSVHSG